MPNDLSPDSCVWSREILDERGVTDRCLRNWISTRKFPPPDGNFNGRNFWLRSTYERWKADVLAGRYARHRRRSAPAAV